MHRRTFLQTTLAATLPGAFFNVFAQEVQQNLRVLVGFPPGGATDAAARWLAERMTGSYAKTAIVENKPGAGGRIAVETTKAAPPDGSTLLITPSSTMALYPHIYSKLSYNPFKDLAPVSHVCDFVHGLAIGPAVPSSVKNLKDFLAWCKANPSKANCANPGDGSSPHFLTSILAQAANVPIQPIPYKGTGPAMNDVVGGQVSAIMVVAEGAYLNFQKEGKLRILATTGGERSRFFPAVPTFKEQGFDGLVFKEWFGLFMAANTPSSIVSRAAAAAQLMLTQKDIIAKFEDFAMAASPSSPEELGRKMREDYDFWAPIVKKSGFNPITS